MCQKIGDVETVGEINLRFTVPFLYYFIVSKVTQYVHFVCFFLFFIFTTIPVLQVITQPLFEIKNWFIHITKFCDNVPILAMELSFMFYTETDGIINV